MVVFISVFLRSPEKGLWACLGDLPPDMPRGCRLGFRCAIYAEIRAFCAAPLSSGRMVPRVTMGRKTPSG